MLLTSLAALAMANTPAAQAAPHIAMLDLAQEAPAAANPPAPAPAASEQGAPAEPATDAPAAAAPVADAVPPADNPDQAEAAVEAVLLRDPWEKPNLAIFKFDLKFEKAILAPAARGYGAVVPRWGRTRISNMISNLNEPSYFVNNVLQLKIGRALKTVTRFVINSSIGLGGMFDMAAKGDLPLRPADFGQTLARYGVKPGPYVMLPFLGPSDLRDGFGRLVDTFSDPVGFVIGGVFTSPGGAGRFVASAVNWRDQNGSTMEAVRGAADPYAFVRAAYSQQRAAAVQDVTGKAAALPDF